jgi:hypothetical protein
LKHAPDREKILLALRRWAIAFGLPDLTMTFVDNAGDVRNAIRAARDARAAAEPVVSALCFSILRTGWWAPRWGTAVGAAAERAGQVVLAAVEGKDAFSAAASQRDNSPGKIAWGITGPTWFFHEAWDLRDRAQNAIWAAAGARSSSEAIRGRSAETQQTLLEKSLGLFEAFEAGAWIIWIGAGMLYVAEIPRQVLADDQGWLHSADGPAFVWLDDIYAFYWHGICVPEYVIMRPAEISAARIEAETDADLRRVMIERSKGE